MWELTMEQVRKGRHINVVVDDLLFIDEKVLPADDASSVYLRTEKDALAFLSVLAVELDNLPFPVKQPRITFLLDYALGPNSDTRRVVKLLNLFVESHILDYKLTNILVLSGSTIDRNWIINKTTKYFGRERVGVLDHKALVEHLNQEPTIKEKDFDNRVR